MSLIIIILYLQILDSASSNAGWIRKKYEDTIITTQGGTDSCFQGRNAGGVPAWLPVVL